MNNSQIKLAKNVGKVEKNVYNFIKVRKKYIFAFDRSCKYFEHT